MLGFEYEGGTIQDMEYSALTTSLTTDKLDVVAAALCKTSERQEVMDFSDVYCDSGLTIMVNKEANAGVTSEADLAGKKVAVETGTASDYYITARVEAGEDITVERNKAITTAYLSLEQNKVDAVIQDVPGANFYVKQTADTKLQVLDLSFYQGESPYAVAFSKNFKWQKEFKDALAQLQEEGYLDELFNKWCK
jgi:polar amino acid transport system substrate-binding protein/glutamine transport system substrate-binding protein